MCREQKISVCIHRNGKKQNPDAVNFPHLSFSHTCHFPTPVIFPHLSFSHTCQFRIPGISHTTKSSMPCDLPHHVIFHAMRSPTPSNFPFQASPTPRNLPCHAISQTSQSKHSYSILSKAPRSGASSAVRKSPFLSRSAPMAYSSRPWSIAGERVSSS